MGVWRLLSRRLLLAVVLLLATGFLAKGVSVFVNSNRDLAAALAQARREQQQAIAACEKRNEEAAALRGRPGVAIVGDQFDCQAIQPYVEDPRFSVATDVPAEVRAHAFYLLVGAFLVAASFVGADWQRGMMATLLTWEPRRGRVLAARALAAIVVVGAGWTLLMAFLTLALYPAGAFRGTTEGVTGEWWQSVAWSWLKVGGLSALIATAAVALTMITRNTAGTLAVAVAYGAIEAGPLTSVRPLYRWLVGPNVAEFLGYPRLSGVVAEGLLPAGSPSAGRAAVMFTFYTLGLLAVAYVAFRYRDVA